jgi:FkbM family methyltransferase
VFDVGANIGMFSLFTASACKNAKIYAFEPIPPVFELLELNKSLYEGHINTFACGLADREGEADFTFYPNASVLSGRFADEAQEMKNVEVFMQNQPSFNEKSGISRSQLDELLGNRLESICFSCRLKTLSQVIREHNIEKIDLLKIDVEKGEWDVLKGIEEAHWPGIRQIAMEVHNVDGRLEKIAAMLKEHGFAVTFAQDNELVGTDLYNLYAWSPHWEQENNHITDYRSKSVQYLEDSWQSPERLIDDIRAHLKTKLPGYMVPSIFMLLDHLPLSPNGKVDKKALPDPEIRAGSGYVAPGNHIEKRIAAIWQKTLNLDKVGINDSFFKMGGTSINIVQVNTLLREEFKRNIPIARMFEYSTIASLAGYLLREMTAGETAGAEKDLFASRRRERNKLRARDRLMKGESNVQ